jgi:NitT/TauT family transport system ATP-binding protein
LRDAGRSFADGRVVALESVSLSVQDGEFLSLLGPSGCGKSTLLRCIAGLDHPSSGEIRFAGQPITAPPEGVGMVFQRDVLVDWRNVLDNVLLAAEFRGLDRRALRPRAIALLERFGLGDFIHRHPWELSGGMRQRAAICRALLCEPSLLLMDEPFGALDSMTREDLNLELMQISQSASCTVVFVTHSINEAVYLSDRIAVMSPRPGRVEAMIDVKLARPRPLAIRETPEFAAHVHEIRAILIRLGVVRA